MSRALPSSPGAAMADLAWFKGWLADAPVRVLDTVTLDQKGKPMTWFYTSSKTGKVATKEPHQLTWPKIGRRFAKFALASEENAKGPRRVAVLLRHDGARAILGEQELSAVARADDSTRATMLEGVGGVQVYLGAEDDYWCRCEAVDTIDGDAAVTSGLGASPAPLASHVHDALDTYTRALRQKAREPSVEAKYVADAHGQFWLSDIQRTGWAGPAAQKPKKHVKKRPGTSSAPNSRGGKLRPLSKETRKQELPVEASRPLFDVHAAARSQAIAKASPRTKASLSLPTPWEQEIQAAKRKQYELLASASDEPSLFQNEATVMTEAPPLHTPAPPPPGSARAFAQQAMADRIVALEAQIASCEERASRAEELRDKTLQKCRELGSELSSRTEALEGELRDSQVQLEIAQLQAETYKNAAPVVQAAPIIKGDDENVNTLLEKLQQKEQALLDAKQNWALERQSMITKTQRTNTGSAYQAHVQANELRALLAEAEDKAQQLTTETAEAKASLKIVEQDNQELRDEVESFRASQRELGEGSSTAGQTNRAAMSLEFGSVKQTFDPATESLMTAHADKAETQRAADTARSEARVRQLHNKVVFLKSSLEMEMDSRAALEKDLRQARNMLQQEREEHESRLADATEGLNAAVESAEARAHSAVAEAHDRASHLETKLASAQAAYSDAVHDAGAARRREEQIKGELRRAKAQEELKAKTIKEQTEKLALLRSQEMGELSQEDRQRQEERALIRRLENEKQYLAAQLKSEATCKGELQGALDKAEERLVETEAQGHKALQNSLESVRKSADRANAAEKELRGVKTEKEAQSIALTKQIEMLQDGYTKTRDALRIEQHHRGREKIQASELIDGAGSLREQIERLEQDRLDDQKRSQEDKEIHLIALRDQERAMKAEGEAARKELRDHHVHLQEVRAKELELRQDFIELQKSVSTAGKLGLALGAAGVGANKRQKRLDALEQKVSGDEQFFGDKYSVPWLRREGASAFATWRVFTLRTKASEENKANVAAAVHEALTRSRDAHEESVEKLVGRLKEERDAAVACSNASSLLEGIEVLDSRMKERDEERDTAREFASGAVANLKEMLTKQKEKAAQIDKARLDLKHEASEAREEAKVALAEAERRALVASRAAAADYDFSAALLAARTARCKTTVAATKFDLERAPSELKEEVQRLVEEVDTCDQFATHAVREAVKAAGAFEALESIPGDLASYRRTADLAADRAGAAIACAGAAARKAENCAMARIVSVRRDAVSYERREVQKGAATAAQELAQVQDEASQALLGKQEQLETAIRAIHAAEVAGAAALELVPPLEQAVREAVREKDGITKKWARDWARSTDRHKAADVACCAVREDLRRIELEASEDLEATDKAADACARAAIASARVEVAEQWRKSVANAEERGTAKEATAWRRGMEERDALAQKEMEKLKRAAERALSDVKRSAAASLNEVRVTTKAALEKAALAAQEREEEAVARTEARARREERFLRNDSEAAMHTSASARLVLDVAALQSKHRRSQRERDVRDERALEEFATEKERLRKDLQAERESGKRELEITERLQKQHSAALGLAEAKVQQEVSLIVKREAEKTDAVRAFDASHGAKLHLEVLALRDMEHLKREVAAAARAKAKAEAYAQDVLIPPLVVALDGSQALSAAYEAQLAAAGRQWDDERDRVVDLRGEVAFQRRQHALREWRTAAKAVVLEKKAELREKNANRAAQEVERALSLQLRRAERKALAIRDQLEERLEDGEQFRGRMHDTLVNHERATLVAHKRRSTELGMELEVIVRDRDELEAERDKILEYVDEMQESVRAIEQAIHAHSKNSAISSDGRVNVAHAKKKKRMDDDHEMLLLGVEKQRNALSETDARLQRLNDARERKEDDMKELERRLVELLVSQQKKLLAILQEAAHATQELDERTPREEEEELGEPSAFSEFSRSSARGVYAS